MPVAAGLVAAGFVLTGLPTIARVLLAAGILMGFLFASPFLPGYTPSRTDLPGCKMGSGDWHAFDGLRAARAQMPMAAGFQAMAHDLDRTDSDFDSAKTPCR